MLDVSKASEIAALYRLGSEAVLSGPVARGEVGQVWRLKTALGQWAVKEPFETPSTDEADDDAKFQEAVLAFGVLMPALLRTRDGDVLADLGSAWIRVYEWVDLCTRDARLDPATVGRIVASIHRVRYVGRTPVDPWYTDPIGAERWSDLVSRLVAAGAPFAERLAAHRDELVAVEELLEWPAQLQTCHRDLFADNVLRTPSGALCVIDWEGSGLADPSQELGLVLFEFGCGEADRVRTLYDAYRDAGGPGRIERPGNFSMVIAQLSHIGETACTRWLDPSRAADREHNAAWADEFVSQPITRRGIDEMLDAIKD